MIENARNLWPCLGEAGLQVLAATADQRYLMGEDLFLATHFPITLRHFPPERPPQAIEESDLLERLTHTGSVQPGNRVFVLHGAAGSGKSELMRWLQVMMARRDPARAEVTVRIPRTELDVLHIAERFQHLLSQTYFSETTRRQWEEAQRKPRTLSKLLLLTALERCLDFDEQINALYYRLLDWIHPRIARSLAAMNDTDSTSDEAPCELLTREDLEQLKTETALPIPLDYEQFRHHLLTAFRDHLMEGMHLPDTLGRIAEDMARRGVRPVLLVDDLVQSVNLFATDLLDYFITLDSGNWDVVVGLTPAALAESNRGRGLLDRISYLDTMDDRVEKLWLSDMQGYDSYFLTEENCAAFAAGYLEAYRARNGWACEACPEQDRCAGLDSNNEGALLVPFNKALLQRLFRGLPNGKGKARYFLRCLREVLAAASNSRDLLTTLQCYARLDTAVEADDETLACVAELYGPPASDHQVTLPAALMVAFGEPAQPVTLPAEPLRHRRLFLEPLASSQPLTDPGRAAIKAWLDGKPANRQSLLQLRKGIARWLRVVCPVEELYAPGVACPHQALRWRRAYLGIRPPIILRGVDDGEGIFVTQDIGLAAFRLYEYATATGDERKTLTASMAQEERLIPILYAAADYRQQAMKRLEDQLGMEIEELALGLYTWLVIAHGPLDERPPGFGEDFWEQVKTTRAQRPVWRTEFDEALCKAICHLFENCFKLRKNVYNGPQIARLINARAPDTLLETLTRMDPDRIDRDYRLSQKPLCTTLAAVQANVRRWNRPDDAEYDLSPAAKAVLEVLLERNRDGIPLSQVPSEVWEELRTTRQEVYGALKVRLVIE